MTDEQRIAVIEKRLSAASLLIAAQKSRTPLMIEDCEWLLAALRDRDRRIAELEGAVRWALEEGETFTDAGRKEFRQRAFPASVSRPEASPK